jgi:hypothetical protein
MSDLKEEKRLTSEECEARLTHAFEHPPHLEQAQGVINDIISSLGEPKLKLKNLHLTNSVKRNLAIKMLAEALKNNSTCKELSLIGLRLEDKEVRFLADMLKDNKNILALDLSYNKITDVGFKYLAEMLKANKTLRVINLFGNDGITDQGTKVLHDILINYQNPSLEICHLKVFSNSIKFPWMKKITDHLAHRRSGAVSQYIAEAKQGIELCLPRELSEIVLGYLPENARIKNEAKKKQIRQGDSKDNNYQDDYNCIKYKEMVVYSPLPFIILPVMFLCCSLSDKVEGVEAEWLRAHTANSIFPNAITISLSLVAVGLISFGLLLYLCEMRPSTYTPVPEPAEQTKKYLVSI